MVSDAHVQLLLSHMCPEICDVWCFRTSVCESPGMHQHLIGPEEIQRLKSILDGLGTTEEEDRALLNGKSAITIACSCQSLSLCLHHLQLQWYQQSMGMIMK